MGTFQRLLDKVNNSLEKKRLYKERIEDMRKQAEAENLISAEMQNRERIRQLAIRKAKQDFINSSGSKKLRAYEAMKGLEQQGVRATWMNSLSQYTRGNILKTQERKKMAAEKLALAKQMSRERILKRRAERMAKIIRLDAIKKMRMGNL